MKSSIITPAVSLIVYCAQANSRSQPSGGIQVLLTAHVSQWELVYQRALGAGRLLTVTATVYSVLPTVQSHVT